MLIDKPSATVPFERRRSRWLLFVAFVVIAVAFLAADYAVVYRLNKMESETHEIVENMLTSVDLVSRMGRDVARERRLIDMHILENDVLLMSKIEGQIVEEQTDFAKAATAYQPLATLPGERAAWEELESTEKEMKTPVDNLLELSRRNQDLKARETLVTLDPRFQDIADHVDRLIQINRQGAEQQVQDLTKLLERVEILQSILSIMGAVVTLVVGWRAIRLIGQREDQLVEKSAMLEQRNRDLDAFAGRVAHDLRNPLNTVNLAGIKLSHQVSDQEAVAILQRAVQRMDGLIEDLLLLSRAGAEPIGVCDPSKAVSDIQEDLSSRLSREGGSLQINVIPGKVRGSQGLLRQVLWNLVDNAMKYRRPEIPVHIEVSGYVQRKSYELTVSDNGIGMAPEESHKAFEPLYRAPRSQRIPGTGLGLSIVKRVIEASGGTISVRSAIGRGTTFVINLPIAEENN